MIAADDSSFPKLLIACCRPHDVTSFSLPAIAEVNLCTEGQQWCSKDTASAWWGNWVSWVFCGWMSEAWDAPCTGQVVLACGWRAAHAALVYCMHAAISNSVTLSVFLREINAALISANPQLRSSTALVSVLQEGRAPFCKQVYNHCCHDGDDLQQRHPGICWGLTWIK